MSEDSLTDGLIKTRPVFGDLTNRPVKRSFLAFSGDKGLKSGEGNVKNFKGQNDDSQFAKQLRFGVEKFIREKSRTSSGIDESEKGLSLLKDKQPCRSSSTSTDTDASQEITQSWVSNIRREFKSNVLDVDTHQSVEEAGEESRDSLTTWPDLWNEACRRRDEGQKLASDATQSDPVIVPSVTVCKDREEGLGVSNLFSKNSTSIEWSKLPKEGFQSHELGRCINLKDDGLANANVDDDILKACSCSFCLKAAYIWSDLQYQDIKGRITALKKSKKEASTLAQSSSRGTGTNVCSQGNPTKPSKLESDLTGQWKSLFCHMEDVLANENNQLQPSFLMLKDLRENCKIDLENVNVITIDMLKPFLTGEALNHPNTYNSVSTC